MKAGAVRKIEAEAATQIQALTRPPLFPSSRDARKAEHIYRNVARDRLPDRYEVQDCGRANSTLRPRRCCIPAFAFGPAQRVGNVACGDARAPRGLAEPRMWCELFSARKG